MIVKVIGDWVIAEVTLHNNLSGDCTVYEIKNEKTGFVDPRFYSNLETAEWNVKCWTEEEAEFTSNRTKDGTLEVYHNGVPVI